MKPKTYFEEDLLNCSGRLSLAILCISLVFGFAVQAQRVDESPFQRAIAGHPEDLIGGLDYVAPTAMAFDSQNRPYMMNMQFGSEYGFIRTMDDNGNWVQRSFMSALQAWEPGASGPVGTPTNLHAVGFITVDADDDLYAIVPTYFGTTTGPLVLLYSTDRGATFQVYDLPAYSGPNNVTMETYTGRNRVSHPPAIGVSAYRATHSHWANYDYLSVLLPAKTPAGYETIGYKKIDRVKPVTATGVQFRCLKAIASPVEIRSMAVYAPCD